MIYDQIYNYVFHEQDLGHVHELKLVERKYQEFYKNERLIITVLQKVQVKGESSCLRGLLWSFLTINLQPASLYRGTRMRLCQIYKFCCDAAF